MTSVNKIIEIISENNPHQAAQKILSLFNVIDSQSTEQSQIQSILVGHLNKKMGYNGFKPIEIGTPVYQWINNNTYYYILMEPISGGKMVEQKYYTYTLSPHINFL